MISPINIENFNYDLSEEHIAKYPLEKRDSSKLLVYKDNIEKDFFSNLLNHIPSNSLIVFNNTKVIKARLIFHKDTGARIEIFCLEPYSPADYERAFSVSKGCQWKCMVGNAKRFTTPLYIDYEDGILCASRIENSNIVEFSWSSEHTFGELLECLGRVPIPPYLARESETLDTSRYQTTYAKFEGSVAAPTAGLHFTEDMMRGVTNKAEVTLHVGAGTFLPVKESDATRHLMHEEFFDVSVEELKKMVQYAGNIIAVGTTTVRTLESLAILGARIEAEGVPDLDNTVGQWEAYHREPTGTELNSLLKYMIDNELEHITCSTQTMITQQYKFRVIKGLVTNFHQPKSTLLLLISAVVGDKWKDIYQYAMDNEFRFLSYGDSSLLMVRARTEQNTTRLR